MCHLSTNTYKEKVFHVEDDVSFAYTGSSRKKNSVLFPIGIEPMT